MCVTTTFPVTKEADPAYYALKDIENTVVCAIDESLPLQVKADASNVAIVAILSQAGHPVAFFSKIFQGYEKYYTSIENEIQAIIKAVHH